VDEYGHVRLDYPGFSVALLRRSFFSFMARPVYPAPGLTIKATEVINSASGLNGPSVL
jgi:hypothetical protein